MEKSADAPWQTAQLSPAEFVMEMACEATGALVWHPMHAAVTGPMGLTSPRGLLTLRSPSGSGGI